ncbi:ABC transporter ATP-binding protein [Tropicimonas sp. IMCC34011]|uniref:ABC transporter ATP-binding protein n=1 Tax=Tropicimonas sp. IMCC34011 TaxID=2248759 RepID=UPI000E233A59|nr:ABC transporter ATP-binding protein [Tropicimonas sp. IMCC34011]
MSTSHQEPGIGDDTSPGLELVDLRKRFGAFEAIRGVDLAVPRGHMVSLIGPSGCGKTTTLRMIAGLETPTSGKVIGHGRVLSDGASVVRPELREMGMVFQTYALWPHMTVARNIGYGLKQKGHEKAAIASRVDEVLKMVGMAVHGGRYPSELSGGQQQRVALARAIASRPDILLFDEPLSNLDAVLREQMRFEIRNLQQELGITSVYVTHSQEESLALSDTIVVMKDGVIVQTGAPREIYDRPRNAFVAGFIGLTNILSLTGVRNTDRAVTGWLEDGTSVTATSQGAPAVAGDTASVSVRPSEIAIDPEGTHPPEGRNTIAGSVRDVVFTGGVIDYFVTTAAGLELRVQAVPPLRAERGQSVILSFDEAKTVILERD